MEREEDDDGSGWEEGGNGEIAISKKGVEKRGRV